MTVPDVRLNRANQCGVSWQIGPENMDDLMTNGTKDEIRRVTAAFLQIMKFDLAALEKGRRRAGEGQGKGRRGNVRPALTPSLRTRS